jgi:hypothetical protein
MTSKQTTYASDVRPQHSDQSYFSFITHESSSTAIEPIQPTTLMTKCKDPIVQIPKSLCKRRRRLESVDIEGLESGQESHDVRKRAKLGWDIFDLGDNASTASLHANDSLRPMNIIIGAPRGVDCNEEVETKNKAVNSSKVQPHQNRNRLLHLKLSLVASMALSLLNSPMRKVLRSIPHYKMQSLGPSYNCGRLPHRCPHSP